MYQLSSNLGTLKKLQDPLSKAFKQINPDKKKANEK